MQRSIMLGLDVGGTKLAAGCVTDGGRVLSHVEVPTDRSLDAEDLYASALNLMKNAVGAAGIGARDLFAVGVGTGGPMTARGQLISPLNIPAWRDFDLASRLDDEFLVPVTVDNDAKALAVAEALFGAGTDHDNFIAMVVSTGVGGGVVVDGSLLHGASTNAGHIGHVVVEPGGRQCACGGRGCLEAEASGTAIGDMTGRPAKDASFEMRQQAGRMVGRGVAHAVTLLDIRVALIAGSVALGFGAPFFEAANAELRRSARLQFADGARILPAGLKSNGPLVGAATVGLVGARYGNEYWSKGRIR